MPKRQSIRTHRARQTSAGLLQAHPSQPFWSSSSLTLASALKVQPVARSTWTQRPWASKAVSARASAGCFPGQSRHPAPCLQLQHSPHKHPPPAHRVSREAREVWRWPSSPSPSGEGHGACTGANAQHAARHGQPHAHDGGSPMRGPPRLPAYGWVAPTRKETGMGGQPGGRGPRASRTDAFTHGQQTGGWDGKGVVKVQRVRRLFTIPFPVFPNPGLQVRRGRHGLWLLGVLKGPEHRELPPSVRCRLRFGP